MRPEKLVSMANQVAAFFRSYPPEEAATGVREHLRAFWTPSMLATLQTHLDADPADVDPLVKHGLRRPSAAENPAARTVPSAARTGELTSDAG